MIIALKIIAAVIVLGVLGLIILANNMFKSGENPFQ